MLQKLANSGYDKIFLYVYALSIKKNSRQVNYTLDIISFADLISLEIHKIPNYNFYKISIKTKILVAIIYFIFFQIKMHIICFIIYLI